ncbi:MAG: FAD-binding oxidoreductase [Clostridiales bacterium]|jgi:D-lactate dehydrogenase (cytochrome)|nr:FAD-binding oxidoreductase [Clostridiales bacterium]
MEIKPFENKYCGYLRDESRKVGFADFIAFPECAAELSEALRFAAERNLNVTVQGARTGFSGGAVPNGGLIISTEKMDRILGVTGTDCGFALNERGGNGIRENCGEKNVCGYVLRAQAGVTLKRIEEFLKKPKTTDGKDADFRGGEYALAPNPTEKNATAGGLFACGAVGLNFLRKGDFAKHIASVKIADACGNTRIINDENEIARLCGAAGKDLETCGVPERNAARGGAGTFCEIKPNLSENGEDVCGAIRQNTVQNGEFSKYAAAEFELRLTRKDIVFWGAVCFFDSEKSAFDFTDALMKRRGGNAGGADLLAALAFFGAETLRLIRGAQTVNSALKVLPEVPDAAKAAVYFELSGMDAEKTEEALFAAADLFEDCGGGETWAAEGEENLQKFRDMCHAATEAVNGLDERERKKCLYGYVDEDGAIISPGRDACVVRRLNGR